MSQTEKFLLYNKLTIYDNDLYALGWRWAPPPVSSSSLPFGVTSTTPPSPGLICPCGALVPDSSYMRDQPGSPVRSHLRFHERYPVPDAD